MFFRNLQVYRLADFMLGFSALEEQLSRGAFKECGPADASSRGWVPPRGLTGECPLAELINGQWVLCLKVQERLLPSSVISDEVSKRAAAIEDQQGYKPGRRQLKELRERVAEELLPQAFRRNRKTYVWIDPDQGWFGVDAATPARAEEVIEHLRHSLDTFPLQLLRTRLSPTAAMADWLASGEAPFGFTLDRECEVKGIGEEKGSVRYTRMPVDGNDVKAHLANGKLPTKLALTWSDRLSFVLTDRLELKRVFILDVAKEQESAENADELFDADFTIMTGEFRRFLPDLVTALGGEVEEAK